MEVQKILKGCLADYEFTMKMKKEIKLLFQKFVNKEISVEELEVFNNYLKKSEHDPEIRQYLADLWEYFEVPGRYRSPGFPNENANNLEEKSREFESLMKAVKNHDDEIEKAIKKFDTEANSLQNSRSRHKSGSKAGFWDWLKRLFIIALVGGGAGVWYRFSHETAVADTEVAYVEKLNEYGQKSTISLPDGSQVKLNSGSKLVFPRSFAANTREVFLEGEAFFEVEKNPGRPFIVRSGDLVTTVLGTSFNIKAYPEEEAIAVTVATGKVKVRKDAATDESTKTTHQEMELSPNQQAIYSLTGDGITKHDVDATKYLSWSNGTLHFEETRFEEVIITLSRWFDVEFEVVNEGLNDCLIIGEYKNASMHTVLESLKVVLGIEYEFTEKGVKIDGRSCDEQGLR